MTQKVTCPTCRRVASRDGDRRDPFWPFCSERCQLVDLGRWLGEDFRIPDETPGSGVPPGADES
jgi:endogenous inhibitor of DNA gyrase (YacG/DUF329 family)